MTALVVDDNDLIRMTISRILTDGGYQVSEVSSGEEALGFLAEWPVDLIVSDLRLGTGINGAELIARAAAVQPRAKSILMSGDVLPGSKNIAHPVLLKPFQGAQLLETASRILREQ